MGNPAEETFCSPESVFSVPEKVPNVQQNIFPFFVRWDRELCQKYCYREGGVKWLETIRCARSGCYRGRNG